MSHNHDFLDDENGTPTNERPRQEQTQNQSTVQRELDRRLLEICNGQLLALGTTINRLTTTILVVGIVCVGMLIWLYQSQNIMCERMFQKLDSIVERQTLQANDVVQAAKDVRCFSERSAKHVWELKRALKLKFSQERSAEERIKDDGEE